MRNVARLKMGYYPLPEAEGVKLRSLLSFAGPASVIDPCVGQGTALHLVTSNAQVRRYGVELDAERARIPPATFRWNDHVDSARNSQIFEWAPDSRAVRCFAPAGENHGNAGAKRGRQEHDAQVPFICGSTRRRFNHD